MAPEGIIIHPDPETEPVEITPVAVRVVVVIVVLVVIVVACNDDILIITLFDLDVIRLSVIPAFYDAHLRITASQTDQHENQHREPSEPRDRCVKLGRQIHGNSLLKMRDRRSSHGLSI